MNLKCVHCEGEAEYLVKGTSYCKEHLPTENKSQDTQVENFDILELKVKKAIIDGCSLKFDQYDIYQTKFMQKVAETRSSWLGTYLTPIVLFIAALGISFVAGAVSGALSALLTIRDISIIDLGIAFFSVFFLGLIFVVIAFWAARKLDPQFETCNEIILNAERRIQTLSKEKEIE